MVKVDKYNFPDDLYYHSKHTWLKIENNSFIVGVDPIGIELSGKIIFLRLKKVGKKLVQGKTFGTAEAGKGVVPLVMPVSGELLEFNPNVQKRKVKLLNEDPFGEGWLVKIQPEANYQEELKNLYHGDNLEEWIKKEIEELNK